MKSTEGRENDQILVPLTPESPDDAFAQPRRNRGALPFKFGDEGGPDSALRV